MPSEVLGRRTLCCLYALSQALLKLSQSARGHFVLLTAVSIMMHVIDHFTVSCLVVWPLNESEAVGDLFLIETSLLFSC